MIKTQKLNTLFDKWEHHVTEYKGKFVRDGIINEPLFDKAKKKVLFIGKEPNNPNGTFGDFREEWNEGVSYTFARRIAEWSFGILNDFPLFNDVEKTGVLESCLTQIAFMNIKKSAGRGSADITTIMKHAKMNCEFINQQIDIIAPDIIITGTSVPQLRDCVFPNMEFKDCGYYIWIGKYRNMKIIDFYHPSSRNAPSAAYCLLKNVIQSEAYRNL